MGFAGLSIGLTLALIDLISIPISNTSVDPAPFTDVAFFSSDGGPAPLGGAAIAGVAEVELTDRPVRDDVLE